LKKTSSTRPRGAAQPITIERIERIERALNIVAQLCKDDPVYDPIFRRLDAELAAAKAGTDPVERMRARVAMRSASR